VLRKRELARKQSSDSSSSKTLDPTEFAGGFPRQAWSVLQQTGDRIRQFEKSLDQLATRVRSDGRQLGHSCDSLEDEVYRVRMLPFSEACAGLERAVRDVALARGKQAQLVIEGADVEVDRSVLEGLKAPLLHLVRNSVDHGVESPADRRAMTKPEVATITVSAALRGAVIEVTVADDGRGIDVARIREVAASRGGYVPSEERDLVRLLFQPGFSTARAVTGVSGRGVGLDVVQSQIEGLHGNVEVAFASGLGTRFTLRVPLTLTTIRSVLLRVNDDIFAVPTNAVRQIVRFASSDLATISGRRCLLTKSSPIPTASLGELLGRPPKPKLERGKHTTGDSQTAKSLGVVLHSSTESALFLIDEVIAEQDIVVKSLGSRVRRLNRVSAATLLPSGQIALLLNVPHLLRLALGQQIHHEPEADTTAPAARRKRLLVADDSMTTRMLIKTILEGADYEVVTAVDGENAWQLLPQQSFDLVVSDVDMPRMNGFDLTTAIRASKPFAQLPIVLVTARETEPDKARGLEVGANAYVTKGGFDQRALLEVISQLV
jgi:two-component system chemotaxis sensor kinase CheA